MSYGRTTKTSKPLHSAAVLVTDWRKRRKSSFGWHNFKITNLRLILYYWLKTTEELNQPNKNPPSGSTCKVKNVQGRCKSQNDFTSEQNIINFSDSLLGRSTKIQHVRTKIQRSQLFRAYTRIVLQHRLRSAFWIKQIMLKFPLKWNLKQMMTSSFTHIF